MMSGDRPPRVAALGVPTRNRPAALHHCLRSYAGNIAVHRRAARVVVVDDSDAPAVREENRAVVTDAVSRQGLRAFYSGPAERQRFARELARHAGAPRHVVEFALLNPSRWFAPGCLRNALLLDTTGELAVMVDDDTSCAVGRRAPADAGLTLAPAVAFDLSFLPRRWTDHPPVAFTDVDFLSLHEALLGRTIPDCLHEAGTFVAPSLSRSRPPEGSGLHVVTTALGYVGDSGMASPALHLLIGNHALQALFLEVRRHGRIWRSGQLLRIVPRGTIAERGVCMAGCLGIDNRRGLPPFLPVLRNEDGLFGRMLEAVLPRGRIGLQPWVVHHQRPAAPQRRGQRATLGRSDTGEVLSYLVGAWPRSLRGEWEERLASLGQWLKDLAAIGPQALFDMLVLGHGRATTALAGILERRLGEHPGAPRLWREDLVRQLEGLRRTMRIREAALPYDLPGCGGPDERLGTLRRLLDDLGELCLAWPALRAEAARGAAAPLSLPVGSAATSILPSPSRRAR
jgi:hypothetical protein